MRHRWFVLTVFAIEAFIVLLCAILLYAKAIDLYSNTNLIILFLLSSVFGSQGVVTKALEVKALPMPAVVTGLMGDLLADPNLFKPFGQNRLRNERTLFLLIFFCGGITGGAILRYVNPATVLIVVATAKTLGCAGYLLVPARVAPESKLAPKQAPVVRDDSKLSDVEGHASLEKI